MQDELKLLRTQKKRGYCMNKQPNAQIGQAMIEYTLVLFLVTFSAGLIHAIGMKKDEEDSLLKAVHDRHAYQKAALSISELPEFSDLKSQAAYYVSMGKYPELAGKLKTGSGTLTPKTQPLNQTRQKVNDTVKTIEKNLNRDMLIMKSKLKIGVCLALIPKNSSVLRGNIKRTDDNTYGVTFYTRYTCYE